MADLGARREWWWITSEAWKVSEPVIALVSYLNDAPWMVEAAGGEEVWAAEHCKLIERILPPGMAGEIAKGLQDCVASWDWEATVERCAAMLGRLTSAGVKVPVEETA